MTKKADCWREQQEWDNEQPLMICPHAHECKICYEFGRTAAIPHVKCSQCEDDCGDGVCAPCVPVEEVNP